EVRNHPLQQFPHGPGDGVAPLYPLERLDDVGGHLVLEEAVDKEEDGPFPADLDLPLQDVEGDADSQAPAHFLQGFVELLSYRRFGGPVHRLPLPARKRTQAGGLGRRFAGLLSADRRRYEEVDDPDDERREQRPEDGDVHARHDELGRPDHHRRDDEPDKPPPEGVDSFAQRGLGHPAQRRDDDGRQQRVEEAHRAKSRKEEADEHQHQGGYDETDDSPEPVQPHHLPSAGFKPTRSVAGGGNTYPCAGLTDLGGRLTLWDGTRGP